MVNLSGSFLFVSASDYACGCLDPEGNILTTIAWSLQMGFAMSTPCGRRWSASRTTCTPAT